MYHIGIMDLYVNVNPTSPYIEQRYLDFELYTIRWKQHNNDVLCGVFATCAVDAVTNVTKLT